MWEKKKQTFSTCIYLFFLSVRIREKAFVISTHMKRNKDKMEERQ